MKRLFTLLFFSLLANFSRAEGAYGTYTIVGTAYGPDSISLKNMELKVRFGKETKLIKTNAQGGYKIEVTWSTACPTGLSEKQIKDENVHLNPEYIYVSYKGKDIKIKNEWEKYTSFAENKVMKKKDLLY